MWLFHDFWCMLKYGGHRGNLYGRRCTQCGKFPL